MNDNFGANCLTIEGYLMQYYFLWDKFIIGTNQQVEWGGCPHWTWTSDETSTKLIPQPGRASPAAWKVEPQCMMQREAPPCLLAQSQVNLNQIFADKFCCCKHPGAWDSCWPTSFWAKVQNAFPCSDKTVMKASFYSFTVVESVFYVYWLLWWNLSWRLPFYWFTIDQSVFLCWRSLVLLRTITFIK